MGFKFRKSSIPNYLTILRILMVPIIVIFLLVDFGPVIYTIHRSNILSWSFNLSFLLAGIFFVVASLTDFIDGYLSRKYNWVSDFGKMWDPIADKVLINSVLICFAYLHLIPVWAPIIMIARDVIVDAARMVAALKNISTPANIYGKFKTVSQMFGIIVIFFIFKSVDSSTIWWWAVQNLMIFVSIFFSLLSGGIYIYQFSKLQTKKDQPN